ncbi:choline ABC transporter substrate-binding protein [Pseudooceanicola sp. CBS1P-1]|uniref:Choline ABC transporter substrate-binding protein n=2 Tax=Paracoccaceae TaxID=31989 RepID=A0A6L7GAD4_9RHOB|nr:choline ABC transporter substrate-binding protein [Pseudooceanicola endophyticus]MXN20498.1 choline ABC transporter substrate-binding protein [Pseudooceanicola albus]
MALADCTEVRLAQPGWTDTALTSGIAQVLLEQLGYKADVSMLSIPIIYESMASKKVDAFLGYWDPAMVKYYKPFKEDGSVVTVSTNLEGAKYTWAVPSYVYDAGVHDFADIAAHGDEFDHKLYGLSPGSNDSMIAAKNSDAFGLKDWDVVESSEQGMLAQVEREVKRKKWIVFLGWEPHPMNTRFDMRYLTGGDEFYGPNFGGATVHTQFRKDYAEECPNVGKLLGQLHFTLKMENVGMGYILDDHMSEPDAARKIIDANPDMLDSWLAGVTSADGAPALETVKKGLGL